MAATTASASADAQVTTVVQSIDAQGPVVVERISTHFADLTCTPENARKLVEALHTGASVTLEADGKTATFTPTGQLGYGEAYIALALAAESLRHAGVTGCATPEQWQAVLMGGPLSASSTTSTSTSRSAVATSTSSFPGILVLRSQGQGWGQVAQSANVQLGTIVSNARTSLKLDAPGENLAPTGRASSDTTSTRSNSDRDTSDAAKGKDHDADRPQATKPDKTVRQERDK